jgi:hypothetical protein
MNETNSVVTNSILYTTLSSKARQLPPLCERRIHDGHEMLAVGKTDVVPQSLNPNFAGRNCTEYEFEVW